jgi:hypothetical protein
MTSRTPPVTAEAADACVEPVSFEAQLPPRPGTPVPSQDPMLIEGWAPTPKITPHVAPSTLTTTTTPLKTYQQQPRSDTARHSASAALRPSTPPPTPPRHV